MQRRMRLVKTDDSSIGTHHAECTRLVATSNMLIDTVDMLIETHHAERSRLVTKHVVELSRLTKTNNELVKTNDALIGTKKELIKTHHIERMKLIETKKKLIDNVSRKLDGLQDAHVQAFDRLYNLQKRMMTHPRPVSKEHGIALMFEEKECGVYEVRYIVGQRTYVSTTVAKACQEGVRELLPFQLVGNGIALRNAFVGEANMRLMIALGGRGQAAATGIKFRNCRSKVVLGVSDFNLGTFQAIIQDLLAEYDVNDLMNDTRYIEIKQDLRNARNVLP
ncbi:unnamed protein product [Peronospora farinosa]|uniref:Uncharacterized protein n=1 Tax=Peronospora farinosa TaxID=134698 RepID=A0AAV0TCP1_9STRA|nr:unnamed protein product [Peronospora farinosa]